MSHPRLQAQGSFLKQRKIHAASSSSSNIRSAASTLPQNRRKTCHHLSKLPFYKHQPLSKPSQQLLHPDLLQPSKPGALPALGASGFWGRPWWQGGASLCSEWWRERWRKRGPRRWKGWARERRAQHRCLLHIQFLCANSAKQLDSRDPGRGSRRFSRGGGRAGRGRGGLDEGDGSSEERVRTLGICIQDARNTSHLPPSSITLCMLNLAQQVNLDTRSGFQYSSSEHADGVDAARKLMRQLLGSSSSSETLASPGRPPVLQLSSARLSQLAWSLSVTVAFDKSLNATAQQLCYALAERAGQPGVMRAKAQEACRSWGGVLYGLAKVGVKCSDNVRVKHAFHFCMDQDLPDLLLGGQKCVPQDVSNVAIACVDAEYGASMEPFVSALAKRVGDPSMGGVGGGLMARADPQAWSNLINACAKLEQRSEKAGAGGLGGGMRVITEVVAAAMADALLKPVKYQPKPQALANTLWGLPYFDWCDARIIGVMAHAVVERIDSCKPVDFSNVLLALARFGWYDANVVSKLAAGMVERIDSSTPQGLSNVLWALSTLGWYDASVYDALLVALLNERDQLSPQTFSIAIYSCAMASHGSSALDGLAQLISRQDVGKQGGWIDQHLANTLYAWVVLSRISITSDSLNTMAQRLMREVNDRGPDAFQTLHLRQLYLAHLEAERVGLQGAVLSSGNGILQAAAEQRVKGQVELVKKARQSGESTKGLRQVAAALQEAGYEVELGGKVGQGDFYAELLVHHKHCPCGIAVDVLSSTDQFRHPAGQLSGKAKLKHAQMRQRCDGLVVLGEAEAKQPGLVVQQLEKVMKGAAM